MPLAQVLIKTRAERVNQPFFEDSTTGVTQSFLEDSAKSGKVSGEGRERGEGA